MDKLPPPPPPPSQLSSGARTNRTKNFLLGSCIFLIVGGIGLMAFLGDTLSTAFDTFEGSDAQVEEMVISGSGDNKIAVINLHGIILSDGTSAEGISSTTEIKQMLKQAKEDEAVKAVILDIDSPGGGVVASSQIYAKIKDLKSSGKPVVAVYTGEVAASGAVYASMGADQIISDPETLTGSIGVIASFYDASELMAKYGIRENVIKSGKFKDIGSLSREMTGEERQMLQSLIDESYNRFVDIVATNRNLTTDQVKLFATGEIYSATRAQSLGMVDRLGGREDAESLARELANLTEASIVEYQPVFSFDSVFDLFSSTLSRLSPLGIVEFSRHSSSFGLYYLLK